MKEKKVSTRLNFILKLASVASNYTSGDQTFDVRIRKPEEDYKRPEAEFRVYTLGQTQSDEYWFLGGEEMTYQEAEEFFLEKIRLAFEDLIGYVLNREGLKKCRAILEEFSGE